MVSPPACFRVWLGSRKGSDWHLWPQSPTQERQELGVFSRIFVQNEKVVADLAGGEPEFAVDFFVALV